MMVEVRLISLSPIEIDALNFMLLFRYSNHWGIKIRTIVKTIVT